MEFRKKFLNYLAVWNPQPSMKYLVLTSSAATVTRVASRGVRKKSETAKDAEGKGVERKPQPTILLFTTPDTSLITLPRTSELPGSDSWDC